MRNYEIQTAFTSSYDKRKLCSYDIEVINEPTTPLIHQQSRFLVFFTGIGKIKIDDKIVNILPHAIISIFPWQITEVIEVGQPLQYIKLVYNMDFINQNMKIQYNYLKEQFSFEKEMTEHPVIYPSLQEWETFIKTFDDIKSEVGVESILDVKEEKLLASVYVTNKLMEVIIWYLRIAHKVDVKIKEVENPDFDERAEIFKYLYSHLGAKLTLGSVSKQFFMSESSLAKYCMDVTGYTFNDLVNQMRIVKTTEFLIYTDVTLNDIAELVGFTDASHLSKTFSKKIGVTPNHYRKINQNLSIELKNNERSVTYDMISYIYSRFTGDITEEDVCKKFNMSINELNRVLLYVVERNFNDFVNYLRINYSCELLLSTDDTIVDIAIAVGFNNARTFTNQFQKQKFMKPTQFRKNIECNI